MCTCSRINLTFIDLHCIWRGNTNSWKALFTGTWAAAGPEVVTSTGAFIMRTCSPSRTFIDTHSLNHRRPHTQRPHRVNNSSVQQSVIPPADVQTVYIVVKIMYWSHECHRFVILNQFELLGGSFPTPCCFCYTCRDALLPVAMAMTHKWCSVISKHQFEYQWIRL